VVSSASFSAHIGVLIFSKRNLARNHFLLRFCAIMSSQTYLLSSIGLVTAAMVFQMSSKKSAEPARSQKAESRRAAIAAVQSRLQGVSVSDDLPYLSQDATGIVSNIISKKEGWTAQSVMEAYIRSAIRAQEASNPLTEILFAEALTEAKAMDARFAQTGEAEGPLHGVPISLKDHFDVKGRDSSLGFSKYCNQPAEEDSDVARIIRKAGGIIFTKTNVPQTMLAFECSNPVFGVTSNPYSQNHTSGGSSGGEGVLAGSDGSALCIGSDIGGSLRIPAHYSGCYGLKPCYGRFPTAGNRPLNPGFESVSVSYGPMGRSIEDLKLMCKTMFDASEAENLWRFSKSPAPPLPWRDVKLPQKLKFGYVRTNTFLPISPACQRAVDMSVDALRTAGHECVEVKFPDVTAAMRLFVAMSSADGYSGLLSHIENDPAEQFLFLLRLQGFLGTTLLGFLTRLVALTDPITASVLGTAGTKSVANLLKAQAERADYACKVRKLLWQELALDGLICPTQATPAIPIGTGWNLAFMAIETILWNIVDSSVGVIPVTKLDPNLDSITPQWSANNAQGAKLLHKAVYGSKGIYDVKAMNGLPIGVQVVGSAWEEERTLAMMQVLDDALGPREFGPGKFTKAKRN